MLKAYCFNPRLDLNLHLLCIDCDITEEDFSTNLYLLLAIRQGPNLRIVLLSVVLCVLLFVFESYSVFAVVLSGFL